MVTDGLMVCSLCLEPRTKCNLCGKAPLIDTPKALADKRKAEDERMNVKLHPNIFYH